MADEESFVDISFFHVEEQLTDKDSASFLVIGAPGSGKTNFIEYFAYCVKHLCPVANVMSGAEVVDHRLEKIFGSSYVFYAYDKEADKKRVDRQKQCINDKDCKNARALYITDDCSEDKKLFTTPLMKGKIRTGSRRFKWYDLYGMQQAFAFPSDIRNSISYVIVFWEDDQKERKKIWSNFVSGTLDWDEFEQLMRQITGDYKYMVIDKRTQSSKVHEKVYWGKAEDMTKKKWRFGCREYTYWDEQRLDPNWEEKFMQNV